VGELWFISIGLWDEKDLSLRAIEAARQCDRLFAELYTTKLATSVERLERLIGRSIEALGRKDLEEGCERLLREAMQGRVGLLVGGDAFVATTHRMLRIEAARRGIKSHVVHGSSIVSAIAESGLHIYKFGKIATVPLPERTKGALPHSVYDAIKLNKGAGLHTLLLLDMDIEQSRFLMPSEAMELLLRVEEERMEGVFTHGTVVMVLARLGSDEPLLRCGRVGELLKEGFGKPPFVLIVPGELHFSEEEYLKYILQDRKLQILLKSNNRYG
jgi:diphthine synthase